MSTDLTARLAQGKTCDSVQTFAEMAGKEMPSPGNRAWSCQQLCSPPSGGSFLRIRPNRGGGGTSRATGQRVPFLMTHPWTQWHLKPDSLHDFPCFMSPERPPTHHNHSHFFKKFRLVSFDFRCLQLESFFGDIKKYSECCLLCAERGGHVRYGFSTRGDGW